MMVVFSMTGSYSILLRAAGYPTGYDIEYQSSAAELEGMLMA